MLENFQEEWKCSTEENASKNQQEMNKVSEMREGRKEGRSVSLIFYICLTHKFSNIFSSCEKMFKCKMLHKKKFIEKIAKFTQAST